MNSMNWTWTEWFKKNLILFALIVASMVVTMLIAWETSEDSVSEWETGGIESSTAEAEEVIICETEAVKEPVFDVYEVTYETVGNAYIETTTEAESETEEVTEVETETEAETETAVIPVTERYEVDGVYLEEYLQAYLYERLEAEGIAWWMPFAICQLYQESRFNPNATNGLDHGICQFRGMYFHEYATAAGLVEYDIWNPIDCIYVYAHTTAVNLQNNNYDVTNTLKAYFNSGDDSLDRKYAEDVLGWQSTLLRK